MTYAETLNEMKEKWKQWLCR